MLWRRLIASSFLCAVSLAAQAPPGAEESAKDRTDARFQQLQQALRERDAIIRNLLERVSELEKKTNISPATGAESAHSVNATLPNNAFPTSTPGQSPNLTSRVITRKTAKHAQPWIAP